jgi:mannose-6-phosphate isomerase-like protein (cupin superfamily)
MSSAVVRDIPAKASSLNELAALTEQLPDTPHGSPPMVHYKGLSGDWCGTALWYEAKVAVQTCTAPAGVLLPAHKHPVTEWLIVYAGRLSVEIGADVRVYSAGECAHFPLGVDHEVTTLEDCSIIAVTIPAEVNYPHAHS